MKVLRIGTGNTLDAWISYIGKKYSQLRDLNLNKWQHTENVGNKEMYQHLSLEYLDN